MLKEANLCFAEGCFYLCMYNTIIRVCEYVCVHVCGCFDAAMDSEDSAHQCFIGHNDYSLVVHKNRCQRSFLHHYPSH